jgi:hypothetical protein
MTKIAGLPKQGSPGFFFTKEVVAAKLFQVGQKGFPACSLKNFVENANQNRGGLTKNANGKNTPTKGALE